MMNPFGVLVLSDANWFVQLGALLFEPHREKTGFLPRRKQRRRSASR